MDEVIAIDEVANAIGLSKDYFGKMFKQHTGMTFRFLYSLIKMEYAKMLIKTCRYKKYEISEMLGYASPDYFAKVFKEVTGMTPSQCRHECS